MRVRQGQPVSAHKTNRNDNAHRGQLAVSVGPGLRLKRYGPSGIHISLIDATGVTDLQFVTLIPNGGRQGIAGTRYVSYEYDVYNKKGKKIATASIPLLNRWEAPVTQAKLGIIVKGWNGMFGSASRASGSAVSIIVLDEVPLVCGS